MKKRLLGLALMVMALVAVLTLGVSADGGITSQAALETAIGNADSGATITLGGVIELDSTLTITNTNSFTIDGGSETNYGFTYAGDDSAAILIIEGVNVKLENLYIEATGDNGYGVQIVGCDDTAASVDIDNCDLTAARPLYIGGYNVSTNSSMYCYDNTVTVTDSELNATIAILSFQASQGKNASGTFGFEVAASDIDISSSDLITSGAIACIDNEGSGRSSGLQDITIENCDIAMDEGDAAIISTHSSVSSYGVFGTELKMDAGTLDDIPGIAYALGKDGGLVANIYTLDDFGYDFSIPTYARYGTTSNNGYYYSFTKTLQLVDNIALDTSLALYFGGAYNGKCVDATLDLNGHTLTLAAGVVLTIRGNSTSLGHQYVIDSSADNSGGIVTNATTITSTSQIAASNTINGNIFIDADVLDEYTGLVKTATPWDWGKYYVINDSTDDYPTMLYDGDTYSIFVTDSTAASDLTLEIGTWITSFTDIPSGVTITNNLTSSKTFTVNGESVTLASGETYTVPAPIVATVTDSNGDVGNFETLAAAVADADNGETVTILENVTLTDNITISEDITITANEGVTVTTGVGITSYDGHGDDARNFIVDEGKTVAFEGITFAVGNYEWASIAIYAKKGANITVNNCVFNAAVTDGGYTYALSAVRSFEATDDNYACYSLTFTNNTVNGDFRKALLIHLGANDTLTITGNEFTADTSNTALSVGGYSSASGMTVAVEDKSAVVIITGNTFEKYKKVISVDGSTAHGIWTIEENKFIDVGYALDLSTTKECNKGYDLSYNYFQAVGEEAGSLMVVLDSGATDQYNNDDDSLNEAGITYMGITLYPYYTVMTETEDGFELSILNFGTIADVDFDSEAEPYATIVEGSEYFAEPTITITVGEVEDVKLTGEITYTYGVTTGDYATVIAAIAAESTKPTGNSFTVTYSFAASGDYAGTITGTIYFAYSAETVVYSVLGNTIYAKLSGETIGKLSVLAPTDENSDILVYNGSAKVASIYDDNSGILGAESIDITYNTADESAPTDAGTYTASITAQGLTASVTFAISKAPVSFSVTGNSFAEGDTPAVVISTTSIPAISSGDYTVAYYDADGEEVTDLSTAAVGTYTIQIEDLNANYYLSGTVGSVVVYEEVEPDKYTVTFEEGDGATTTVTDLEAAIATTVRTLADAPTKTGYTFTGWSYDGKIYTAGAQFVQPEGDVIMSATWSKNAAFTVAITDKNDVAITTATVSLTDGITTTTNDTGDYSFSDIPLGAYDMTVTYTSGESTVTTTTHVTITGDTALDVTMYDVSVASSVVVEEGLNTTTVAKLDTVATAAATDGSVDVAETDSVELKVYVTSANDDSALTEITDKSENVGYTMDISVDKIINNAEITPVTDISDIVEDTQLAITVDLPAEMQGMAYYTVLRYHDGTVDTLTTNKNSDGEYIELVSTTIDGVNVTTAITIHASKFSTYGITSSETVPSTSGSTNTGTIIYPDGEETEEEEEVETEVETDDDSFKDVDSDDYFYDAVEWAVDNDITSGMTTTTFAPNNDCTREQVVTFLWRAIGSPEMDAEDGFSDVDDDGYYADAVAWAIENGITQGMSDDLFGTGETATRGQIVTFLYRLAGEPEMAGDSDFTDVDAEAYYYDAVLWAVENGITDGMGNGTFAPDSPCTRAQIVTFLYRYFN